MPWWFFRRRSRGSTSPARPASTSPSSAGWQLGEVALPRLQGSRRYLQEQPYLLPKDLGEINRLDFQHYVLRAALRGNYLAPIQQPRRILDVGCGTGQWAFELAQQFPQAEVIGLDLEQIKASASPPPNYRFVQGDLLEGLPFDSDSLDFVHQRLLVLALPLTAWPGIVKDLARVTAPGGWVELLEAGTALQDYMPSGPATQEFYRLGAQLAALRGLDTEGLVMRSLARYLEEAGLINIHYQPLDIPLGEWGGRIGSLMALDLREVWKAISAPIAARFGKPEQEVLALIDQASQEWNQFRTTCRFAVAYGQKPGRP
ncbi:MAG: methyltransferase domain-containing protein [Thermogemmatispora sp.]|uniref:class I SAM-dependent methyltransferase n=1 Tax=Thermogemmatispora sp. TaxID=1968838 RepID=UPI002602D0CB|nr:class I SAM-dependent methyltransferase [Thermogemmatispora sp.]MBX5459330.1 methyltransferase domain-containing protein [Thermogemmatispora sp.]